ncbi:MAG: DeoR family transcriptional regulator [Alphaproteobacteria bacterium]
MRKLIQLNELEQCPCFNLRKMARELTNDYNNSLKLTGINSTQIPILALLNIYDQLGTTKIASMLDLETSTIRRNLAILTNKGLIKIIKKDVNGNLFCLAKDGFNKLKETLPIWRKSHKEGVKKIQNFRKVLKRVSS